MEAKKVLILLNDADPLLNRVVKNRLETVLGWNCVIAVSYEQAIEVFDTEKPDIVVSEILILDDKNRDGISLVAELRSKEVHKDAKVPLIIFSEMDTDEMFESALKVGATACYSKNKLSMNDFISELKKYTR